MRPRSCQYVAASGQQEEESAKSLTDIVEEGDHSLRTDMSVVVMDSHRWEVALLDNPDLDSMTFLGGWNQEKYAIRESFLSCRGKVEERAQTSDSVGGL